MAIVPDFYSFLLEKKADISGVTLTPVNGIDDIKASEQVEITNGTNLLDVAKSINLYYGFIIDFTSGKSKTTRRYKYIAGNEKKAPSYFIVTKSDDKSLSIASRSESEDLIIDKTNIVFVGSEKDITNKDLGKYIFININLANGNDDASEVYLKLFNKLVFNKLIKSKWSTLSNFKSEISSKYINNGTFIIGELKTYDVSKKTGNGEKFSDNYIECKTLDNNKSYRIGIENKDKKSYSTNSTGSIQAIISDVNGDKPTKIFDGKKNCFITPNIKVKDDNDGIDFLKGSILAYGTDKSRNDKLRTDYAELKAMTFGNLNENSTAEDIQKYFKDLFSGEYFKNKEKEAKEITKAPKEESSETVVEESFYNYLLSKYTRINESTSDSRYTYQNFLDDIKNNVNGLGDKLGKLKEDYPDGIYVKHDGVERLETPEDYLYHTIVKNFQGSDSSLLDYSTLNKKRLEQKRSRYKEHYDVDIHILSGIDKGVDEKNIKDIVQCLKTVVSCLYSYFLIPIIGKDNKEVYIPVYSVLEEGEKKGGFTRKDKSDEENAYNTISYQLYSQGIKSVNSGGTNGNFIVSILKGNAWKQDRMIHTTGDERTSSAVGFGGQEVVRANDDDIDSARQSTDQTVDKQKYVEEQNLIKELQDAKFNKIGDAVSASKTFLSNIDKLKLNDAYTVKIISYSPGNGSSGVTRNGQYVETIFQDENGKIDPRRSERFLRKGKNFLRMMKNYVLGKITETYSKHFLIAYKSGEIDFNSLFDKYVKQIRNFMNEYGDEDDIYDEIKKYISVTSKDVDKKSNTTTKYEPIISITNSEDIVKQSKGSVKYYGDNAIKDIEDKYIDKVNSYLKTVSDALDKNKENVE